MSVTATREASPPPALEVRELEAGPPEAVVLRGVSLLVPHGSVTALLGPNGAGKTTLLRTVSGFARTRSGTVHMHGQDVTASKPYQRAVAGLCHIPEGRGIFAGLTVRENLFLQATAGNEREAVERATSAFPILGKRLSQRAGTLSGGQQQMLALAAAYVQRPSLLLVDEASLGLAPIVVDEIFTFLRDRAAEGTAILIVDQFVFRALEFATTAYVLRKGRIVLSGSASEVGQADVFGHYLGTESDT